MEIEVRPYPKALAIAFGRVFYGAQGRVYFSQVIFDNFESVGRCYQKNDPISDTASDVLDTDGGEIYIQEAGNILWLEPFRSGVLVFCDNGVWFIAGSTDTGFSATGYIVTKVAPYTLYAKRSVIAARDVILFGGKEACYIVQEQTAGLVTIEPITERTIDSVWKDFVTEQTSATYDEIEKQVHFVSNGTSGKVLVFDAKLSAWFPWDITLDTPTYTFSLVGSVWNDTERKVIYSVYDGTEIRFCKQGDNLYDFEAAGTYSSYVVTQPETASAYTRNKGVPLIQVFFRRTESQITAYTGGQYVFDKPSACNLSVRFDWDTTKQTDERSIYKALPFRYVAPTVPYTLPFGNEMVTYKDKIRGKGRAVQVKLSSIGNNRLDLYGYAIQYSIKSTA